MLRIIKSADSFVQLSCFTMPQNSSPHSVHASHSDALIQQMIGIGRKADQRRWVPASGGNFSARLAHHQVLVTRSGVHKGELTESDFLIVDMNGKAIDPDKKPSAETLLHCERYRAMPNIGAVLHTHSVASTLMPADAGALTLQNYELLKIFEGIDTHESSISIPVFANDQDMPRLAAKIADSNPAHAYIIAGHGIYVWGKDLSECYNRVEALEFLLDCEWQKQRWS